MTKGIPILMKHNKTVDLEIAQMIEEGLKTYSRRMRLFTYVDIGPPVGYFVNGVSALTPPAAIDVVFSYTIDPVSHNVGGTIDVYMLGQLIIALGENITQIKLIDVVS